MARLIATFAVVFALFSSTASFAQGLTASDLGSFMGAWTLVLETPQGAFEQELVFMDEGGKVVAEMSNEMQGTQKITDVSKDGENVIMKFAGDFQGNPFDATVTLVPDGTDKVKVSFDINAGQFMMDGTGTKK
jgi:hypothetical protein